jgi:EAL domain-containing protein (putative c-di-GMP-specific phosphodiesterase class I)
MSVNISRHDLVDEELADFVDAALARPGFPHDRLPLEITESALEGGPERAKRCVRELRARGSRISMDDFRVGYSSMSQLLELSIDELKIDKSFVFGLGSDPRARAIVRSAIELGRAPSALSSSPKASSQTTCSSRSRPGGDIGQGKMISHHLRCSWTNTSPGRRIFGDCAPSPHGSSWPRADTAWRTERRASSFADHQCHVVGWDIRANAETLSLALRIWL